MKKIKIALMLMISLGAMAQKEKPQKVKNHYLGVEVDPAPFILGGYSFSLKYSHEKLKHFTVMGSVYSSKFPDKMMDKKNYEKGFRDLKIKTSYALFADYFVKSNRTGLHFGPSVFLYSKSVEQPLKAGRADFGSIFPNFRVGYVYEPFKRAGFYINPWLNVGKEFRLNHCKPCGQSSTVNFAPSNLSYILAVHFGYRHTF